jgi:peptide chain release factor 2
MKVLRARLFDLKMKEQQAKLDQIGGEKRDIAFGSQIRNYVLQPYQMVKDLRTKAPWATSTGCSAATSTASSRRT